MFYIDFVPETGKWVRIEKDFENLIWLCMHKEPRIKIESVLNRIGWKNYFFCRIQKKRKKHVFENKSLNFRTTQIKYGNRKFLISISNQFQDQKIQILQSVKNFSDHQIYDLGYIGRKRINNRFNQTMPISARCLMPTDFVRAMSELNKLNTIKIITRFDDLDNLRV